MDFDDIIERLKDADTKEEVLKSVKKDLRKEGLIFNNLEKYLEDFLKFHALLEKALNK